MSTGTLEEETKHLIGKIITITISPFLYSKASCIYVIVLSVYVIVNKKTPVRT